MNAQREKVRQMMKLYEISEEIRRIMDAVDPETGEMTDEQAAALDMLDMDFGRSMVRWSRASF